MIRDVKEIQESTLWEDTGRQIKNKNKSGPQEQMKTVVFVVGERYSGKTSFLKIVRNDFDPETKPNSLVEYQLSQVGRDKKHLVHFYQIGHKNLLPLLSSFSNKKDINLVVLVCVDLSRGRHLVNETAEILNKVRELSSWERKVDRQITANHEDSQFITAMSVRVGVVGCKWDLFEKLDLESKKWISRSLRYLAHTHCGSILTASNKNNTLGLNLRSAFVEFFLAEPASTAKNARDYSKPLFVRFGDDRISDMNLPTSGSMTNIQMLEKQLESAIPHDPKLTESKRDVPEVHATEGKLEQALRLKRKELFRFVKTGQQGARRQADFV